MTAKCSFLHHNLTKVCDSKCSNLTTFTSFKISACITTKFSMENVYPKLVRKWFQIFSTYIHKNLATKCVAISNLVDQRQMAV